jgi:DNA-binding response OmpR family regulator
MKSEAKQPKQVFAMMAVADAGIRMSFGYLFTVVLERSLHASSSCAEVMQNLESGQQCKVLIISCPNEEAESLELIRHAAQMPNPPVIIVLDSKGGSGFGAEAFKAGADDVVRPPYPLKEFAYRLKTRLNEKADLEELAEEKISWDAEAFVARQARLTTAEAQVVRILISKDGEIVTRDDLSHAIDHRPWTYGDRKFDVHVAKIRKKLQAAFGSTISVKTIRSAGYTLTVDEGGLETSSH